METSQQNSLQWGNKFDYKDQKESCASKNIVFFIFKIAFIFWDASYHLKEDNSKWNEMLYLRFVYQL